MRQPSTAKPISVTARATEAQRTSLSVPTYVGMNEIQIIPMAKVENVMYLDSLKFLGNHMLKMANPMMRMIRTVS